MLIFRFFPLHFFFSFFFPPFFLWVRFQVTIVPRTQAALGFARYDTVEKKLFSKEELFDRMCMALAGRAAELQFFNRSTTGAEDDLKKVLVISVILKFFLIVSRFFL